MSARLRDYVNQLTRPHHTSTLIDGETHIGQQDGLIQQLRDAYQDTGGSGGAGGKHKVPINVPAHDLLNHIHQTASAWLFNRYSAPVPAVQQFSTEEVVKGWAAASVINDDATAEAERIMGGWVLLIRQMFNPIKHIPIPGQCPNCQATHKTSTTEDGTIHTPTLTAHLQPGDTTITCGTCQTEWAGDDLHDLAETLKENAA